MSKTGKVITPIEKVMIIEILEKRYLPCCSEALKVSSIAKIDSSRMSGM